MSNELDEHYHQSNDFSVILVSDNKNEDMFCTRWKIYFNFAPTTNYLSSSRSKIFLAFETYKNTLFNLDQIFDTQN